MAMNCKYKEVNLGNGIAYATTMNMDATKRQAFAAGFNLEASNYRAGSMNDIYYGMGRKLRARLDSGDMIVRKADGFLVPAGLPYSEVA